MCTNCGGSESYMRKWINLLAALAVLLHAGAVVRHNASALGVALQHQVLLTDLGVICHDGSAASSLPASDLPRLPKPDTQSGCPICSGLVAAFALPAVGGAALWVPPETNWPFVAAAAAATQLPRGNLPPARGPPARA